MTSYFEAATRCRRLPKTILRDRVDDELHRGTTTKVAASALGAHSPATYKYTVTNLPDTVLRNREHHAKELTAHLKQLEKEEKADAEVVLGKEKARQRALQAQFDEQVRCAKQIREENRTAAWEAEQAERKRRERVANLERQYGDSFLWADSNKTALARPAVIEHNRPLWSDLAADAGCTISVPPMQPLSRSDRQVLEKSLGKVSTRESAAAALALTEQADALNLSAVTVDIDADFASPGRPHSRIQSASPNERMGRKQSGLRISAGTYRRPTRQQLDDEILLDVLNY